MCKVWIITRCANISTNNQVSVGWWCDRYWLLFRWHIGSSQRWPSCFNDTSGTEQQHETKTQCKTDAGFDSPHFQPFQLSVVRPTSLSNSTNDAVVVEDDPSKRYVYTHCETMIITLVCVDDVCKRILERNFEKGLAGKIFRSRESRMDRHGTVRPVFD
jgi:hypothetical protein